MKKFLVTGEVYTRHGEGDQIAILYTGDELLVWRKIAEIHSYGYEEDATVDEIKETVSSSNGDGCDWIDIFEIHGDAVPLVNFSDFHIVEVREEKHG